MTLEAIILTSISSALMITFAAFYAAFYALYRIRKKNELLYFSYLFFGLLVFSTSILSSLLSLEGIWIAIMTIMLTGYWFAPKFIWRLSHEVKYRNYSEGEKRYE
ncbi:MAG: hypothetical protein QF513_00250 [Gammaproteobacteria bacterium]|jgi:H+/gluconate symporter-like permease|nr:hypothetical protein [Gammaproteobacteria bacterium]